MLHLIRHHLAFVVMVVAVLALGVGATVMLFALVSALWLRPLPFPDADRLVVLMRDQPTPGSDESLAAGDVESGGA